MKKRRGTSNRKLLAALEEAEALLGNRDGCHSLQNTYHALVLLSALERQGVEVEDELIVKLLCEMRVTAQSGVPPGANSFDEVRNQYSEAISKQPAGLSPELEEVNEIKSLIDRVTALAEMGKKERKRTMSLITEARKLAARRDGNSESQ